MLFIVIFLPGVTLAGQFIIQPLISVSAEYDDNILFTREEVGQISDFLGKVRPALGLDYQTERLLLHADLAVDIWRYLNESELDLENQYYTLGVSYNVWEKLRVSGDFSYVRDTTLESELLETGVVAGLRDDRERLSGTAAFTYSFDELSRFDFSYTRSQTEYDSPRLFDYVNDAIAAVYEFGSKNEVDLFSIRPNYSHYDSDASTVDNFGLSFGWFHPFSETLRLNAVLGARYTLGTRRFVVGGVVVPGFETTGSDWGGVADVSLQKSDERYSAGVRFTNDLSYTAFGEPVNISRLSGSARRNVTEDLAVGIGAGVNFSRFLGDFARDDAWFFSVGPTLDYRLTRDLYLRAAYTYQYALDEGVVDDTGRDRNRVWVTLGWNIPERRLP